MQKNKTIQKLISFLIIVLVFIPAFLLSKPKQANACFGIVCVAEVGPFGWLSKVFQGSTAVSSSAGAASGAAGATAGATNTGLHIKDFAQEILRQSIMVIEKKLLQEITKGTINWINSGFHGAPLFLENPASFFNDIGKFEIMNLINATGYNPNNYPFGEQFALNIIGSYKQTFASNAQYSLSKVINDPTLLSNYRNFNVSGWNGFLTNSMSPQNNFLGYNLLANNELAKKLQGLEQNNINKVKTTLQQGMGFLSPQACPSNPLYNNGTNEFKKPVYKPVAFDLPAPKKELVPNPNYGPGSDISVPPMIEQETQASKDARANYAEGWTEVDAAQRATWSAKNSCPGGLKSTTPGSVVANQITTAMGSQFRQSELGAALGNSIGAILDALLNHFMQEGLNSLASAINPPPASNNFNYQGLTLGSPTDSGTNGTWYSGPDIPIILTDFKKQLSGKSVVTANTNTGGSCSVTDLSTGNPILNQNDCAAKSGIWTPGAGTTTTEQIGNTGSGTYIPGDIANTTLEIQLMNNDSTTNPGISQLLGQIWPKIRQLDICTPGPDLGWQDRLQSELQKNQGKAPTNNLQNTTDFSQPTPTQLSQGNTNPDQEDAVLQILTDLKLSVSYFQDWISNNMAKELPNSTTYIDTVSGIKDLYSESDQLDLKKQTKANALIRLQSISDALSNITTQPAPGSTEEKTLISLKQKYDAVALDMSNATTIADTRNELDTLKDKLANTNKLIDKCTVERLNKGWNAPDYSNPDANALTSFANSSCTTNPAGKRTCTPGTLVSEQSIFCEAPIVGGYSHGAFVNTSGVTHPQIPLVNAQDVLRSVSSPGDSQVDINLSCKNIYRGNVFDYKGNLPGITYVLDTQN